MKPRLEITDEYLVLLVLLENKEKRNITEVIDLLNVAYEKSKYTVFRGARATITNRLKKLHLVGYLGSLKDKSGNKLYWIIEQGLECVKEAEKEQFKALAITAWCEIFKAVKSQAR